jgi:hypothetical protein
VSELPDEEQARGSRDQPSAAESKTSLFICHLGGKDGVKDLTQNPSARYPGAAITDAPPPHGGAGADAPRRL